MDIFTLTRILLNEEQMYMRAITTISKKTGLTPDQVISFVKKTATETILTINQIVAFWLDHAELFGRNLDFRKSFTENGEYIPASDLNRLYKPSDVDAYAEEDKKMYICQVKDVKLDGYFYADGVRYRKRTKHWAESCSGTSYFSTLSIVVVWGRKNLRDDVRLD